MRYLYVETFDNTNEEREEKFEESDNVEVSEVEIHPDIHNARPSWSEHRDGEDL